MFAHTQSLTVIKRLSLLTLLTASSYAFALDVNFGIVSGMVKRFLRAVVSKI